MGVRVGSTTLPMPRGGGPELNEYAQEVKVILETAFSEIGGAATPLTASTGLVAANNLSDLISAATARINLGLAIGTNVEAWSANLDTLSALSSALANAGKVPMVANAGGWSLGTTLMDDRIINGAMRIDQRRVGAAVTPGAGNNYITDRWCLIVTQASKITAQQLAPSPALGGFTHALKLTVASAFTAGAGDAFLITQPIEGNNVADFAWGSAGAKSVIASFWAQASVTGTYAASFRQQSGARSYVATFSLPVANTWTYITLAIPGDVLGTWSTDTNIGIYVGIDLGSGSNFTGASAGSWLATNSLRAAGCVNFVANAAATFWLTGVRLQPGSTATPLVLRPHGLELMLCQRYYQKNYAQPAAPGSVTGSTNGTLIGYSTSTGNSIWLCSLLPVPMRGVPTGTAYSYATGASGVFRDDSLGVDVAIGGIAGSEMSVMILCVAAGASHQCQALYTLDDEL